jgi:hypothetical protein
MAVARTVPVSEGRIWISGGQAAQRGRFALPRLEWERGKGGANRPGERRAADDGKNLWSSAVSAVDASRGLVPGKLGAAQRGRFALPRLEWERGKGGANRPGERRAAEVFVEDFGVLHGLPLNGLVS